MTAMAAPISTATHDLGLRIRELRHGLGWTQEKLAEVSSLHWTYIGQIERGERNVSLRNLTRVARALDVDLGDLTRGLRPW
jgi:transcriptional regulator with XRE-family HTH domain